MVENLISNNNVSFTTSLHLEKKLQFINMLALELH